MTYKEKIIRELEISPKGYTCAQLVTWIKLSHAEDKEKKRITIMSTISGILNKMWKNDEIYISSHKKGKRGGAVYLLNKEI